MQSKLILDTLYNNSSKIMIVQIIVLRIISLVVLITKINLQNPVEAEIPQEYDTSVLRDADPRFVHIDKHIHASHPHMGFSHFHHHHAHFPVHQGVLIKKTFIKKFRDNEDDVAEEDSTLGNAAFDLQPPPQQAEAIPPQFNSDLRDADPRFVHIHKHIHAGDSHWGSENWHHHEPHHHVHWPVHHDHHHHHLVHAPIHHEPKGLLIKKTIIKKFRDNEEMGSNGEQEPPRFKRALTDYEIKSNDNEENREKNEEAPGKIKK